MEQHLLKSMLPQVFLKVQFLKVQYLVLSFFSFTSIMSLYRTSAALSSHQISASGSERDSRPYVVQLRIRLDYCLSGRLALRPVKLDPYLPLTIEWSNWAQGENSVLWLTSE